MRFLDQIEAMSKRQGRIEIENVFYHHGLKSFKDSTGRSESYEAQFIRQIHIEIKNNQSSYVFMSARS